MPTTAQQLIEAAYARSTANDPGKLAGDAELLGVANRVYQYLYAIAAALAPDSYLARVPIQLVASVGTLPADLVDIRRLQSATGAKVYIIPIEEVDRVWHIAPAVVRVGLTIVSRGNVGDPGAGDVLTAWILDAPGTLATLAAVLDPRFPVRNHEGIVLALAIYLAIKDTGRDSAEYAALKAERDGFMETFLRLSGLSLTALASPHGARLMQRFDALLQAPGA